MEENKMGVMPIGKLLLNMSVPMMLSMLVQALYNIVDSIFVAQLNENALTAVSLAFPIQNLMIAVGSGTAVGVNALLSKSLGEKKPEYASKVANNGIILALLSSLAFLIITLAFSGVYFDIQTKDAQILSYGNSYTKIIGAFSFGMFLQIMFERLLQSTGKTIYAMITQMIGAIINIILDPIMIFGLFGFPRLEVAGAAYATVSGQIIAAICAFVLNVKKNKELTISVRKYGLSGQVVKNIYSVGIPSIMMASIGSITTFCMNKILMSYTPTATAVYGVYFKLQSFAFMPVFGLNNGMVPIVSYNYGAKRPKRIVKTIKLSIAAAVTIMITCLCVFQLIPEILLGFFKASDEMLKIGVPALRTISLSFLFAGFCIISCSVFQALGHGFLSLSVSVLRQLVVLIPAAFLLSSTGVLSNVWFAFPIAEIVSVVICALYMRKVYVKKIKPLY